MKCKMCRHWCLAAGILFSNIVQAQPGKLDVGDKVPEITFSSIINHSSKTIKTSDFNDKLLILDFWATWCHPCIAAFPKIDSVQKYFGDRILILPVTSQDTRLVTEFLGRIHKKKNLVIPTVTNAPQSIWKYFPHTIIPHCIWIYKGEVKAITESKEITKDNIQRLLTENVLNVRMKDDGSKRIDRSTSMFNIGYNARQTINDSSIIIPFDTSKVKFYSIITNDYTENENGFGYPLGFTGNGITIGNCILQKLFLWAFGEMQANFVFENRLVIETKDSAKYDPSGRKGLEARDWMNQGHSYSYELKVPVELFDKRFKIMQNDLNNYFGTVLSIVGSIEKRKRLCLVLQKIDGSNRFETKGGVPMINASSFNLKLKNVNVSWLIDRLREYRFNQTKEYYYSIVSDIGIETKVDIEINGNLSDLDEVNRELQQYGLIFAKEEREIDVVVIKDKK